MAEDFFQRAKRVTFPKLKASAMSLMIVSDPDPKLCLELGAAILFDKPILALVPRGQTCPLSLRTVAHKVLEISNPPSSGDAVAIEEALRELEKTWEFRKGAAPDSILDSKPSEPDRK